MKRAILTIVPIALLLLLAVASRLYLRSRFEAIFLDKAAQRIQTRAHLSAAQNGYFDLADDLNVKIDRPSPHATPGDTHLPPSQALADYDKGTEAATLKALNDGKVADRQAFEAALPRIRQAIEKPWFALPFEPGSHLGRTIDPLLAARRLAESLYADGIWAESQGHGAEALQDYLLILRLGVQLQKQGPLTTAVMGDAIALRGVTSLLTTLSTKRLTPLQYRTVRTALDHLPVDTLDFARSVDEDVWDEQQELDVMSGAEPGPARLLSQVVGYFQSKDSVTAYQSYRLCIMQLHTPAELRVQVPDNMMVDGYLRALTLRRQCLSYLYAARLVAALHVYHAEHQGWPATLGRLGVDVPKDPMTDGQSYLYRRSGTEMQLGSWSPLWREAGYRSDSINFYPYHAPDP